MVITFGRKPTIKSSTIFKIQDEIASAVIKALKTSLLAADAERAAGTGNQDAHRAFMQGNYFAGRGTVADSQKAREYFQEAVRLDPTYALAWAELSRNLSSAVGREMAVVREQAFSASKMALTLNPSLPEAHIAAGKLKFYFDWDWQAADTEFKRALELDLRNADALKWEGFVAATLGRIDDAVRLGEQSVAEDPLNTDAYNDLAEHYLAAGRMVEAEAAYRRALSLNPAYRGGLHGEIAETLLLRGKRRRP
ncbi:MAG: tetratricopeptide repeat protein [Steroidobacteraceae bacterium]